MITFSILIHCLLAASSLEEPVFEPTSSESPSLDKVFEDASAWLYGIEGINMVEEGGGKVKLSGSLQRASDIQKIEDFVRRYSTLVKNETKLSAPALDFTEKVLQEKIKQARSSARLRREGSVFFISGTIDSKLLDELKMIYPKIYISGILQAFRDNSYFRTAVP